MAVMISLQATTPSAREVATNVSNLRTVLEDTPNIYKKIAEAMGNGGAANVKAIFAVTSDAEAQALNDKYNAVSAWINGTSTLTGAEVLALLNDLVYAFYVTG